MSLFGWFQGQGPSGFGYNSTAEEVTEGLDLRGQRILITGAASGLGLETVRVLALRGARVVATARTEERARQATLDMGEIEPMACDLSEPDSVRGCVERVKEGGKLSAIIANAGIMALPELTLQHGYEAQFFTNHVGHFLLVTSLLDQLAEDGRVVVVSSAAHTQVPPGGIAFDNLDGSRSYDPWLAYGQSKLANLLFAKELAKRLAGTRRTANAVHPGGIRTNLSRHMNGGIQLALAVMNPLFLKDVAQGAATQCYVAVHPKAAGISGEYFVDCNIAPSSPLSRDAALAARLWEETARIVAGL